MSDHLPECIYTPERFDPEQNIVWDGKPCICDRLRACEQRVREEDRALIAVEQTTLAELNAEYRKGLDAAREAVERVSTLFEPLGPALAAIDALRGES